MVSWLGLDRSVARRSYDLYLPAVSRDVTAEREGVRLILEMEMESGVPIKIRDPDQIIDAKGVRGVAQKMRQLNKSTRLLFDYLRMTTNSRIPPRANREQIYRADAILVLVAQQAGFFFECNC